MSDNLDWPIDEGIWMAEFENLGWFPIQTMALRDDLPSLDEIRRERLGETMPPRPILCIVAQFPESEQSWPYLFRGNHPAKQWRRPDAGELERAKKFYGITQPKEKGAE